MPVSSIARPPAPQMYAAPAAHPSNTRYPPQLITGFIRNPEMLRAFEQLRQIGRTMEYYSPSYSGKSFFEAVALPTNGEFLADDLRKLVYWKGQEYPDIFCHYLLNAESYKESMRLIKCPSSRWGPEIESLLVMLVSQSCGLKVVLLKDFAPPMRWDAEKAVNDTHVVIAREKDPAGHCLYYACLKLDPNDKTGSTIIEVSPTHALSWAPVEAMNEALVGKVAEECEIKTTGRIGAIVANPCYVGQGSAMDQLAQMHLTVVPVPEDNNSFFVSVWKRSGREFDFPDAHQMRIEVQAHADVNRDEFNVYLAKNLDYSHAVESMFNDNTWSPDWEELATNVMLELGINLIILRDFKEPVRAEGCEEDPFDPKRHTVIVQRGHFYLSTKPLLE
ncbi:uncharacterized protein [Watersipora subatra]|uniref:uncharacterized protein n=1 Tax=Watersipora subatra TaxID=2589382 RepID=UPI00355BE36C